MTRRWSEDELAAMFRVPLQSFVVMRNRAATRWLPRTADALNEIAIMVHQSGISLSPSSWQGSRE